MSTWDVLRALTTFPAFQCRINMFPAEKKAIDDAMSWLRNNDPNLDDVDDATAQALGNLAGCEDARQRFRKEKAHT
jgi:hypothetical protein